MRRKYTAAAAPAEPDAAPSRHRRKWFLALYAAFLLIAVFLVLKLVRVESDVWTYYYPELRGSRVLDTTLLRGTPSYDILVLGGSVAQQIEERLAERLQSDLNNNAQLFFLSTTAHTTRDSWLKYRQLGNKQFDLVIVCHGINDVRMNYWPSEEFKNDYTHCPWYARLTLDTSSGKLTLWEKMASFAEQEGLGPPSEDDYTYGETLKTGDAFEQNLQQLCREAKRRSDPVLLLTMPFYLTKIYARDDFDAGRLDYGEGDSKFPAELWGEPGQVAAGITEHNRRTRLVSSRFRNVRLADLVSFVAPSGKNFSDICHLTSVGEQQFVDAVVPVIVQMVKTR